MSSMAKGLASTFHGDVSVTIVLEISSVVLTPQEPSSLRRPAAGAQATVAHNAPLVDHHQNFFSLPLAALLNPNPSATEIPIVTHARWAPMGISRIHHGSAVD